MRTPVDIRSARAAYVRSCVAEALALLHQAELAGDDHLAVLVIAAISELRSAENEVMAGALGSGVVE